MKGDFEMRIQDLNLQSLLGLSGAGKLDGDLSVAPQRQAIKMTNIGGGATKQVTSADIENFVNEPRPSKAAKGILDKSPVGLGSEPSQDDLKKMGYKFVGTGFHIGAPVFYESSDGGTVTIYPGGGSPEAGEDKRKIVYEKGNLKQEMYYDDNGNLKSGEILVKDNIAGFTARSIRIAVDNGKPSFIG